MTVEQLKILRNTIPVLFGLLCVVGLLVGQFVWFLIGAAVLSGIAFAVIGRLTASARGESRQRNRNRDRNRRPEPQDTEA